MRTFFYKKIKDPIGKIHLDPYSSMITPRINEIINYAMAINGKEIPETIYAGITFRKHKMRGSAYVEKYSYFVAKVLVGNVYVFFIFCKNRLVLQNLLDQIDEDYDNIKLGKFERYAKRSNRS